ncbi:preprotein translocase subunit Sec61beta [Candidatus Nanohalovita haloferacivicina]|uniref:preprotein translocase subunit Sec61beta n=1 Tax=Candidatus Nanohalovita haloferacivicina TaxID=2978046 RepID=UPI00325FA1F7|nr:Preprotein translocase subunit Sec61beta [Candidatus Nanohalobia archaeon BNXNv]
MANNQQQGGQLPSGQGGLVQYFDADSGIEIDPKMIIAFGLLVSVFEIGLHMGIIGI